MNASARFPIALLYRQAVQVYVCNGTQIDSDGPIALAEYPASAHGAEQVRDGARVERVPRELLELALDELEVVCRVHDVSASGKGHQ